MGVQVPLLAQRNPLETRGFLLSGPSGLRGFRLGGNYFPTLSYRSWVPLKDAKVASQTGALQNIPVHVVALGDVERGVTQGLGHHLPCRSEPGGQSAVQPSHRVGADHWRPGARAERPGPTEQHIDPSFPFVLAGPDALWLEVEEVVLLERVFENRGLEISLSAVPFAST